MFLLVKMFDLFKLLIQYWQISLLAISLLFNYFQHTRLEVCSMKVSTFQAQFDQLKKESEDAHLRAVQAKKEAEASLVKSKQKAAMIMASSVPQGCSDSIQWGIEQAQLMK